ncbi:MAG: hypothetical protein WBV82_09495 [Myxococcaceae bacterium]
MKKLLAALMVLSGPAALAQIDATEVEPKIEKEAESLKEKTQQAFNTEYSYDVEGTVKSVDDKNIVLERENLPDVKLSVRDQTKVEQDGEQTSVKALKEGDQVQAQFQVLNAEPVAVEISARSTTQQPETGMGGGGDAGTK